MTRQTMRQNDRVKSAQKANLKKTKQNKKE
jgi:hypothetical protein